VSFQQIIDNVKVISYYRNACLAISKYDRIGVNRFLIIDLSHQNETRSNYINDLESICNDSQCRNVILHVNSVSQSCFDKLITFCDLTLLDAKLDMGNINGIDYFALLNSWDEHDGYTVWCPSLCPNITTERELYEYYDQLI